MKKVLHQVFPKSLLIDIARKEESSHLMLLLPLLHPLESWDARVTILFI
jgi:hypothetical protein